MSDHFRGNHANDIDGRKSYYPAMLDVTDRPCVIVGGGSVAERKAAALLEAGAKVTVVSPTITGQFEAWEAEGKLEVLAQPYTVGMPILAKAWLIFTATDNAEVNAQVHAEAEALGKLVNVVDDAGASSFIVPSFMRRGELTIAVSTGGSSPAAAVVVRKQLELMFGEEYGSYLDLLHELRLALQKTVDDTKIRQKLFRMMLDWPLLALFQMGLMDETLQTELVRRVVEEPTIEGIERVGAWLSLQMPVKGQ